MLYSFRGLKIHYSDSGSGKTIVLIHGYLETMKVWESFSKRLALYFRVLVIDLPGHGKSDPAGDINTMDLFAEAIKELLEELGICKVFLAGHSMGGYATLAFVRLFPEYLSGYSLFHSHPLADTPETIQRRKLSIKAIEEGKKEMIIPDFVQGLYAKTNLNKFKKAIERSMEIASDTDEKTIIADLKGMIARPSMEEVITNGKVPFLWILGKMDIHINHETVMQNVRLPENCRVVILNKSGHMGFIEEEDKAVELLTEFVDDLIY